MTLGRRLAWALSALLVTLALAFTAVGFAQRSSLYAQVDDQLVALSTNARGLVALSNRTGAATSQVALLADVYIGRIRPNGTLVTLLAPTDDPDLVPALTGSERTGVAVSRPTSSGVAARVRLVVAPLDGTRAVVATSSAGVDEALRRLVVTLLLAYATLLAVAGLAWWWVRRLGLEPIARMTAVSDAVTEQAHRGAVTGQPVVDTDPATEAGRLGRALTAMIDATAANEERLRRFVADASHELRTPLTTLSGYSSLYAAGGLREPGAVDDAMRRIHGEAGRMSRLVSDLLDLAAIDESRSRATGPVDLAALVHDVAADLSVADPGRSISVETPEPLVVTGDADRLLQAVAALATNAARHTPLEAGVVLRARRQGPVARVEVRDAGPGIPAAALPHLFERFFRVDPSRAGGSGGSGLGLAIVAAIITAHDGRYGADSVVGEGSTFWFELPMA
jgi:two-component system OmpR family sensor kinase